MIWKELTENNKDLPDDERITYFGITDSRNKKQPFGIKKEDRSRHSYVIGKTGMGKSTLLENMAAQDILSGEGLCFIDPHGGSAEKLLEYVPENRVKDVLYFAPFDLEYPISFNVLENVDADKRHLVVAGLMSTFEKIWVDAWSSRMAYILQNTLGALLEFPGATLLSVNRMYIDKEYRKNVIAKVKDPSVRSFWVDEYSKYTDRYAQEATPAIQNKIGQFASNALVRNVIGQSESSFDIRKLMDEKKIFIVNLSKGRIGEGNANLLGSMLITKIYLSAMSRADTDKTDMRKLPPFYLYVDEFQNFANKSFADILSEARKYKLALTIAHQYIEQMEDEVRAAVFGNVGTMMTFRVGAYDAEVLEKEFAPVFTADDLVNLGKFQLYLKLMIDGVSSQPFSAVTMPPVDDPEVSYRDMSIAYSRTQYSRPRSEVEESIKKWSDFKYEDPNKAEKDAARAKRRAERERSGGNGAVTMQNSSKKHSGFNNKRNNNTNYKKPKINNEEHKKDLRDILSKMTKKEDADTNTHTEISKKQNTKQNTPVLQKDDGKSVTNEGKQKLRKLLSSLNKEKKETPKPYAPKKKCMKKDFVKSKKTQQKIDTDVVPNQDAGPSTNKEIPKEKMKEMLYVKKPKL